MMSADNRRTPRKALNKAYLKIKPSREQMERFKRELKKLIHALRPDESEEFNKNHISAFLREAYYKHDYFINTKDRTDLVIHNGKRDKDTVGVLIETKRPGNKAEMVSRENLNTKAMQELVLYFLDERITSGNDELKHLVATNGHEWFIFDAQDFEKAFAHDKKLVARYKDFRAGRLTATGTDYFYTEIAAPAIAAHTQSLSYTWFDIREYAAFLENPAKETRLIPLLKILSPEHLLKLPFLNDSNSLDRSFYTELLYIIGLCEIKRAGKKLIERFPDPERKSGSLLENTIMQLDSLGKMEQFRGKQAYGENQDERLFTVSLELVLTWVNRVLFLKLLEGQLLAYNQTKDQRQKTDDFAFLHSGRVHDLDDLNTLFFQVLAQRPETRRERVADRFGEIPYLNSSLFEITEMENTCFTIAQLDDGETLPIHPQTVLKDRSGRRRTGELNTLDYLFEFLNAYDFSSEGSEDIQEESKTLINASVLGLIFEKINGYKDGSFYTPGFITMYMCRETIRRAVVEKFNAAWERNWACFDDLKEDFHEAIKAAPEGRESFRQKANDVFKTLRICDPAVGSGHFLVSALNEMIVIKSELRILTDREGKLLSGYQFDVANDELVVTDTEDQLFTYHRLDKESQRLQEALFHEKQTLIENCLFGVDINPNSVKICRLRLWIELLKNAYYRDDGQLETLPNIDINIKCGNSLISRFALDADVKQALKKSKWNVSSYRLAVASYRNAQSKDVKRAMEALIQDIKGNFRSEISAHDPKVVKLRKLKGELMDLTMQTELFKKTAKEKAAWNKKVKSFTAQARKLEAEIEEIKTNKLFENAFEWRFEFPEVLDDNGTFVGFDAVIGNPPYVQIQSLPDAIKTILAMQGYSTFSKTADLYCLFYERGGTLLGEHGILCYISSNKFFRSGYGKPLRQFLGHKFSLKRLIDFGDAPVFDAIAYASILLGLKAPPPADSSLTGYIWEAGASFDQVENVVAENGIVMDQGVLSPSGWKIESPTVFRLLDKLKQAGTPLGDYVNGRFYYGIKTGFNDAFIIDRATRDRLVAEDPNAAEILKPFLRGRDVKRWQIEPKDLWLINTHNGYGDTPPINIDDYPVIKAHLDEVERKRAAGELGDKAKKAKGLFKREDQGATPYNLRNCAYVPEFDKPKIVYPDIYEHQSFALDLTGHFSVNTTYFIPDGKPWLLAVLNSKLIEWYYRNISNSVRGGYLRAFTDYMQQIPIPVATPEQKQALEALVEQILAAKQADPKADVQSLETEIDQIVYQLYDLSPVEIRLVEGDICVDNKGAECQR
jgi:adenine-specific DNA-methyltransferase